MNTQGQLQPPPRPAPSDLGRLPLFGGLSEDALRAFAEQAEVRSVHEGELVFREDEPARNLFVLAEGALDVVKRRGDGEVHLWKIRPGESFGEMSFIDMQPRSASVRASAASTIWGWSYATFRERYEKEPKTYLLIVMNVARELSRRLRRADDLLARER